MVMLYIYRAITTTVVITTSLPNPYGITVIFTVPDNAAKF